MSRILSCVLLVCAAASAVTLRQMSLTDMTTSATAIVRATVTATSTSRIGPTIYTRYKLRVSETWKGTAPSEVLLPGGTYAGLRQSFPGVPQLATGNEYVLFLWTSPSTGITHVVGFSQGIFSVTYQSDGTPLAGRSATAETMHNASGAEVRDQAVSMTVSAMKALVTGAQQ